MQKEWLTLAQNLVQKAIFPDRSVGIIDVHGARTPQSANNVTIGFSRMSARTSRKARRYRNVVVCWPCMTPPGWPGVYVMITIFCDFRPFSAKNIAFFSKTNVMIIFLQKLEVAWAKNANIFAKFFGENIVKIITSVPDWANVCHLGILKLNTNSQKLTCFYGKNPRIKFK
jgi:hypothetical protein